MDKSTTIKDAEDNAATMTDAHQAKQDLGDWKHSPSLEDALRAYETQSQTCYDLCLDLENEPSVDIDSKVYALALRSLLGSGYWLETSICLNRAWQLAEDAERRQREELHAMLATVMALGTVVSRTLRSSGWKTRRLSNTTKAAKPQMLHHGQRQSASPVANRIVSWAAAKSRGLAAGDEKSLLELDMLMDAWQCGEAMQAEANDDAD